MKNHPLHRIIPFAILTAFLSPLALHAESRDWSNREGKVIQAELVKYDLSYQVSDPQNKIASVEFLDASGTKLKSTGFTSSDFDGTKKVSFSFQVMPPPDAVAKIYLVTDRAVVTVPFDLKDIPLP